MLKGSMRAATLVIAGLVTGAAFPGQTVAQDQPLVFVHGLTGQGSNWAFIAPTIQNQFKVFALTPTLGSEQVYATQAGNLHSALAGQTGAAAVSHSNGGIVVRQYLNQFGSGSRIDRHMSIGSLHGGSELAGNVLNNNISYWGFYVFDAIRSPFQYYRLWDPDFPDLPAIAIEAAAGAFASGFASLGVTVGLFGFDLGWDVLDQMPPGSSTFATLNSAGGLQNEAARTTARVSLATRVSPLRMPAELISLDPALFDGIRFALMDVAAVMYYYYKDHPDLLLSVNAYRWANMFWALYDINAVWQYMIGALISYRRFDMEWVSNDGVVHWFTSRYPNSTNFLERASPEINHLEQLVSTEVRNHVVDVVGGDFGISARGSGGGGGGGPQALSVSISGPTEISPTALCSWVSSPSGGTTPYSHQWYRNGSLVATASDYTGGMNGASSFTLFLRVTDSAGAVRTDEITVTDTGFGECLLT